MSKSKVKPVSLSLPEEAIAWCDRWAGVLKISRSAVVLRALRICAAWTEHSAAMLAEQREFVEAVVGMLEERGALDDGSAESHVLGDAFQVPEGGSQKVTRAKPFKRAEIIDGEKFKDVT